MPQYSEAGSDTRLPVQAKISQHNTQSYCPFKIDSLD